MANRKRLRTPPRKGGGRFRAREDDSSNPESGHPVFCFRHIQDGYGVTDCEKDELKQLIEKLCKLSQMEWVDIYSAHRHGLGAEKIDQNAIRPPLPRVVTGDVTLLAIRFDRMKPMIGFRSGAAFRILWLDRDFTVYRHA